jgi:hypothetical protein
LSSASLNPAPGGVFLAALPRLDRDALPLAKTVRAGSR